MSECTCSADGHCPRFGRRMAGMARQLCEGKTLPPGWTEEMRQDYLNKLEHGQGQHGNLAIGRRSPELKLSEAEQAAYPSVLEMGLNYLREWRAWRAAGKPVVSQAVFDERHATCRACDKYDAKQDRCTSCGCPASKAGGNWLSRAVAKITGNSDQLGALWWATKGCPHPDRPKWLPVINSRA